MTSASDLDALLPGGARLPSLDTRDDLYSFPSSIPVGQRHRLRHDIEVRDQGKLPCCVSIAIATSMEILDGAQGDVVELSPLFHYHSALEGAAPTDIEPRTGLRVAARSGICAHQYHRVAFDAEGARTPPTRKAIEDALQRRLSERNPLTRYELVNVERSTKARTAIARGFPVIIAFHITAAYRALAHGRGVRHEAAGNENSSIGHAVVAVGYDDEQAAFLIKDSRGPSFGRAGHWLMPYEMSDSRLVHEMWVLRRISYDT